MGPGTDSELLFHEYTKKDKEELNIQVHSHTHKKSFTYTHVVRVTIHIHMHVQIHTQIHIHIQHTCIHAYTYTYTYTNHHPLSRFDPIIRLIQNSQEFRAMFQDNLAKQRDRVGKVHGFSYAAHRFDSTTRPIGRAVHNMPALIHTAVQISRLRHNLYEGKQARLMSPAPPKRTACTEGFLLVVSRQWTFALPGRFRSELNLQ